MQTRTTNVKSGTALRLPTIVTRNGQITITAPIREALDIKEGDTISIALEGEKVKLEPISLPLTESYQSVPALSTSHSWKDVLEITHEYHAAEVMKEG